MLEPNVQWLFDQIKAATHMGVLHTVSTIVKLEVDSGEAYTKDEAVMQQLRECWKQSEAWLANEEIEREKLSGEHESDAEQG
jgi:allophanate hydrolase subunit 1